MPPRDPAPTSAVPLSERWLRPVLHRYWRLTRGLTLGVRGAVLDGENRVLLVRHTYAKGWHMPGGGVEPRETALAALARELDEEACVALAGPPRLHGVFFNRKVGKRDHVLVYVVRDFAVRAEKRPDREIAEIGFFPLDALPEATTAPTRRRLAEIAAGAADLPEAW
ncbi:MAG TPA: NUDIX domain-containing protein [Microvirga sp.]|jgi:8-oxo-dGTP pyrophosphatase MutT (NUDIX family)|nr:NUDIX domain-containing protein [Microvirga sp.]